MSSMQKEPPQTPETQANPSLKLQKNQQLRRSDNSLFGRVIESKWFWIPFVAIAFALPIYRSLSKRTPTLPPVLGSMGEFKLTNQYGKPMGSAELQGSVLVVNFIFTQCPDVCPRTTAQMAKLQSRMMSSYPAIRLISISVDPTHDTPEVLKAYADKYRAEYRLWSFLTGPLDIIQKVIVDGFKMTRLEDSKNADIMTITHGENFVIVDQLGQIRAYRQANNDTDLNNIIQTVAILANSKPKAQEPATVIDAGGTLTR